MRLHEFTVPRAVPHYSAAISPGKHCPLFGVGAVLRGIRHVTLIYLGTHDCVYFAKKESMEHAGNGSLAGARVLAAQLTDSDLVLGAGPALRELLLREASRPETKEIYLVTSCAVELISEDISGVVEEVRSCTSKRIALIPTENFKTFSYFDGMEQALAALTKGRAPREKDERSFAVLGVRHQGAWESEPVRMLCQAGYRLQSILPFETSPDRLEGLPGVAFTLVLDGTGLQTAKQLEADHGIPYVRFDQKLRRGAVTNAYDRLEKLTGCGFSAWAQRQEHEVEQLREEVSAQVTGKTFFYSQVILYPFETCLFLAELGMRPTCIFLGSVMDPSSECQEALQRLADPLLLQNASFLAVRDQLEEECPDYFIGAVGEVIRNYPVRHVNFRTIPLEAGYTFQKNCLHQLKKEEGYLAGV